MRYLALGLFCLLCCDAVRVDHRHRRRPRPSVLSRGRNDSAVQSNSVESLCKGKPLDFVFIIDSSRSVRPSDYEKVKTFITNILAFLDVGPEATRVGLLQYGSVVQNEFSLNTYSSKADVERAVKAMDHLATGTMTGLAIQYTMETAFTEPEGARPADMHIPRIAMIVTDGRPQDTVEEVSAQARQAGIQIFAIGVGRVDMNTLRAIGSEPHSEHVYLVGNFSQIETLTSVFQSNLCGGTDLCSVVDHRCDHLCVSTPASYMCRCRKGYTLNSDGKSCRSEDPCAVVDHGCAHICAKVPGVLGYECRCRLGYELNEDARTCRRIDYCDLGNHGCQHDCVSTPESYICRCTRGYVLNLDGKTCSKIDHCALGDHGCEHECVNTEDSFFCKCREGYILRPDNTTCKKLDPCSLGNHGCEHDCVNTEDSFVCRCREGYTLRPDNRTCKKAECGDGVMDLVFVIDGSKSLGPANFELVKQFVNGIVDSLDVSGIGTHVGLLQYSTKVRTEFTLGQYTSGQDINRAVSRMQYMGRGSMTGAALRHMFEYSFSAKEGARPDMPWVSIVFTDGRSQDDVSKWAAKAKDAGINIYAIGVGKAIEEELREIASEPDDKHLYYAEDFSHMGEIADKLKTRICKEKPSPEEMCKCDNVMLFQRQVNEQLRRLTQHIEVVSKRMETLESQLGHK
ncbi:matrilin-2 isoform X1 [Coregonus clupeaformis]|uniref:matrilin-2 isoform X1 n=1 Tax=Coregonus clupeaformis TaxID=59861 RepID=UPI001E1C2981|nr:matrilin-2 isoform X1 [Coregonus clupeaformis]XP_045081808.1 matrilin-2 isoform X1 [Coregonus clupeaformis]